mmetsp:Transcript_96602/g.269571  ORF Transcript_96602/g.269571 Transcript_96602/m.269571 type:complete len:246 (+) Transcript_96602:733-1470(+)
MGSFTCSFSSLLLPSGRPDNLDGVDHADLLDPEHTADPHRRLRGGARDRDVPEVYPAEVPEELVPHRHGHAGARLDHGRDRLREQSGAHHVVRHRRAGRRGGAAPEEPAHPAPCAAHQDCAAEEDVADGEGQDLLADSQHRGEHPHHAPALAGPQSLHQLSLVRGRLHGGGRQPVACSLQHGGDELELFVCDLFTLVVDAIHSRVHGHTAAELSRTRLHDLCSGLRLGGFLLRSWQYYCKPRAAP